jgi:hypothetical protein
MNDHNFLVHRGMYENFSTSFSEGHLDLLYKKRKERYFAIFIILDAISSLWNMETEFEILWIDEMAFTDKLKRGAGCRSAPPRPAPRLLRKATLFIHNWVAGFHYRNVECQRRHWN